MPCLAVRPGADRLHGVVLEGRLRAYSGRGHGWPATPLDPSPLPAFSRASVTDAKWGHHYDIDTGARVKSFIVSHQWVNAGGIIGDGCCQTL